MNSRERVMNTLNHSEPDKLPIELGDYETGIHIITYRNLIDYLGIEDKNIGYNNFPGQTANPCEELLEFFDTDTRWLRSPLAFLRERYILGVEGKFQGIWDQFGIFWGSGAEKVSDEILYYESAINPLSKMTTV